MYLSRMRTLNGKLSNSLWVTSDFACTVQGHSSTQATIKSWATICLYSSMPNMTMTLKILTRDYFGVCSLYAWVNVCMSSITRILKLASLGTHRHTLWPTGSGYRGCQTVWSLLTQLHRWYVWCQEDHPQDDRILGSGGSIRIVV